jgi:ABC-2 type transport system permease protein
MSFSAEQLLTSALLYATTERDIVAYAIQGHGESNLASLGLTAAMENDNYLVRYINLPTVREVPPDADMVLLMGPTFDLPAEDAGKIGSYLAEGGRALILLDIPSIPNSRPITNDLLKSYGISMRNLLVVEGDTGQIALGNPLYLLPKLEYHDITEPLNKSNLRIFIPSAQAIEMLPARKAYLTIEPLLSSSSQSWGKERYQNLPSLDREEKDPAGPFTLSVAITGKSNDPARKDMKLVVVSSSVFLKEQFRSAMPGSSEFFLNTLAWMNEKSINIAIRAKDTSASRLRIDSGSTYALAGITVILMPLLVLGWGFVVWMRRRHL